MFQILITMTAVGAVLYAMTLLNTDTESAAREKAEDAVEQVINHMRSGDEEAPPISNVIPLKEQVNTTPSEVQTTKQRLESPRVDSESQAACCEGEPPDLSAEEVLTDAEPIPIEDLYTVKSISDPKTFLPVTVGRYEDKHTFGDYLEQSREYSRVLRETGRIFNN